VNTIEVVLTYLGAILIAMEFVRKFTDLQALMGILIGWPVSPFLGEKGRKVLSETYKNHKLNVILRMILAVILCLLSLPLTVAFYVIWFVILVLNTFHNWVNRLYSEGRERYRPLYISLIRLTLSAHRKSEPKRFAGLNEQKVMHEIEKREIPILPLVGVILISIAFVLFFV
jgi:hypothetical protein